MINKLQSAFLLFIIFAILSPNAFSKTIQIDSDRQFNYAWHLFSAGDFESAIPEYKRFIFFFKDDPRIKHAMYQIAMAYYNMKNFRMAAQSFMIITDKFKDDDLIPDDFVTLAWFRISECYLFLNAGDQAVNHLENLISLTENQKIINEARYRIGWIFTNMGKWEKALASFSKISKEGQNKYRLKNLNKELKKADEIPSKNPDVAGFLAIMPGLGHIYCERYQDAAVSFLLNGALIASAFFAFDNENPALGGLLSLIEIGFYSGNIYSAVTSAHKYNLNQQAIFIDKLRKKVKVKLSAIPEKKGIFLSFQYDF